MGHADGVDASSAGVDVGDLVGAVYEPTSGYADPQSTAASYLKAACDLGVKFRPYTEMLGWRRTRDRIVGMTSSAGPVDAGCVILATGPWSVGLANSLGVDLPITASRHQIVILKELRRPARPVLSDPRNLVYVRPEGLELTLVGSNDPADANDVVDPDKCPQTADQSKVEWMVAAASRRIPGLVNAGIAGHWSGVYDVSADGFPILGRIANEVIVAAGMSGHGFKLSPAIGEIIASTVLGSSDSDPRSHLFRPSRFEENDPVNSITTSSLTTMLRPQVT